MINEKYLDKYCNITAHPDNGPKFIENNGVLFTAEFYVFYFLKMLRDNEEPEDNVFFKIKENVALHLFENDGTKSLKDLEAILDKKDGLIFRQTPESKDKATRDNLSGILCLLGLLEAKSGTSYIKRIDLKNSDISHPRDRALLKMLKYRGTKLVYLYLFLYAIHSIFSCITHYKYRPEIWEAIAIWWKTNKWPKITKMIGTDGEIIFIILAIVFPMPFITSINDKLLRRRFGKNYLTAIFQDIYFHKGHPVADMAVSVERFFNEIFTKLKE